MGNHDSLSQRQIARNLESVDGWSLYENHRQRVTNLLAQHGSQDRSLCIVGAGNCNDLDLSFLLQRFGKLTLIDLDADAMRAGIDRQSIENNSRIHILKQEVTGIHKWLSESANDLSDSPALLLSELIDRLKQTGDIGQYDVAASVCLLSQLIEFVEFRFVDPDQKLAAISAIRKQHLQMLSRATKQSGCSIVVNEIVSSDTLPELLTTSNQELAPTISRAIQAGNFFSGLNPQAVAEAVRAISPNATVELTSPWVWNFAHRTYAVYAVVASDS
jgi:hypothetical protein